MDKDQEAVKIAGFLTVAAPIITRLSRMVLESHRYQVREEGAGLDLVLSISTGHGEVRFFLRNLFLEVATLDRDEEPLRFDQDLLDFGYFLSKTADLIRSKLKLLLHLLETESVEEACKKIQADSAGYERVRIWRRLDAERRDPEEGGGAYD
jgi:hypothetical protein